MIKDTLVYCGCDIDNNYTTHHFVKIHDKNSFEKIKLDQKRLRNYFDNNLYDIIGITKKNLGEKDFIKNNNYPVYNWVSQELLCDTITIVAVLETNKDTYYKIVKFDSEIIDVSEKVLSYYNNTIGISNKDIIDKLPHIEIKNEQERNRLHNRNIIKGYNNTLLIENDINELVINNDTQTIFDKQCYWIIKPLDTSERAIHIKTLDLSHITKEIVSDFKIDCKDTNLVIERLIIRESIRFDISRDDNLEIGNIEFRGRSKLTIWDLHCFYCKNIINETDFGVSIQNCLDCAIFLDDNILISNINDIKSSFSCCSGTNFTLLNCSSIKNSFKEITAREINLKGVYHVSEYSFNRSTIGEGGIHIKNAREVAEIKNSFIDIIIDQIEINNSNLVITESFNNILPLSKVILECKMASKSFCECTNITDLKLDGLISNSFVNANIDEYTLEDNHLRIHGKFAKESTIFTITDGKLRTQLTSINKDKLIVRNVKKIFSGAFKNPTISFKEIDFGNDIDYLGARSLCFNMIDLNLWDWVNIHKIEENVFEDCSINNLILPQNLEELPNGTFKDCVHFENLVIPKSVVKIHKDIFNAKAIRSYNEGEQPNVFVFRGSEAEKFFKRKRMNMIVIDSIDEAMNIIYGVNNRNLIKARMMLSNIEEYKEYIDDPKYKNSLHILYKIDTFLKEDLQESSKYYPLKGALNIDIKSIPSLYNVYKESCISCSKDSRIDIFVKERISLWMFIVMQKSLSVKQFSNEIYRKLNEYCKILSTFTFYHDQNGYTLYQEVYKINTSNDDDERSKIKVLYLLDRDKIMYITFVNIVDTDKNIQYRKENGILNIFNINEQESNYRFLSSESDININQRKSCILNILNKGDILNKSYTGRTKIDNKLMPFKYNQALAKEFLRQHITLFIEYNALKKYDDGKETVSYGYFVNIFNFKVVHAKVRVSGSVKYGIVDVISIEILDILASIPNELANKILKLSLNDKCMHIYSKITLRDTYIDKLKDSKFAYDNDPVDEIILANKIVKSGIFDKDSLSKSLLFEILNSAFALKVPNINNAEELRYSSLGVDRYNIAGLEITQYRINNYSKYIKLVKSFDDEVVLEIKDGKKLVTYRCITNMDKILGILFLLGVNHNTIEFKSDGYSISNKDTSMDEYIIIGQVKRYKQAIACIHKNSKMAYLICSFKEVAKQIFRFKSLKSLVEYIDTISFDPSGNQFSGLYAIVRELTLNYKEENELLDLRDKIIDGLPNGVWISDTLEETIKYLAKQPKIN